jgi:K+-sensing histidine kinase KdpD
MESLREKTSDRLINELNALIEVAKSLVTPVELPELLDGVMKTMVKTMDLADIGAIMLWDQAECVFRPAASFGYDQEMLEGVGLSRGESITGKVFDEGVACMLTTPEDVTRVMVSLRPYNRHVMLHSLGRDILPQSAIAAPISTTNDRYGVLVLESLENGTFTDDDLSFVQTLADLLALAIDRERLQIRADAVKDARQSERMRSESMATLSHELRMPLSMVKGYTTALMLGEVDWSDEKGKEFLELIEEACNDMEGIIQDILDSSIIDVKQLHLEYQPIQLATIAREVAAEVEHRSELHHPVVDFPSDFPIIHADPRWIKQVFRNILDNAVKYSPQGGLIFLKGEVRDSDVVIGIADQGIGISSEDVIPIFEKYHRVRSVSTLHVPGTGLGLPIARGIVEAHGGRIWVESKLGEGSTVFFSLPRKLPSEDDA